MAEFYVGKRDIGDTFTPGIRLWSNGMPIKADTYKSCSNRCTYCYARVMTSAMQARAGIKFNPRIARTMSLRQIAGVFERAQKIAEGWLYWAIRGKYFVELGTIREVFQEVDLFTRVSYSFIKMCSAYGIPLCINTKGNLLRRDDYFGLLANHSAPVIISLSLSGHDDAVLSEYEPCAPTASERLALITRLRCAGIPTCVYCGPFIPGVTDVDFEGYIEALIDAGAVAIHLRNFYITGKLQRVPRWMKYLGEHADKFEAHGHGWRLIPAYLKQWFPRARAVADKKSAPNFAVVGMKTHALELEPGYGKIKIDWLPPEFRDGVIDFTAIPILRCIYLNRDRPQVLRWSCVGYEEDKVAHPVAVPLAGGVLNEASWLNQGCKGCIAHRYRDEGSGFVDGFEWVVGALWSGLEGDWRRSFIADVAHIYPVLDGQGIAFDASGRPVYAYVPPEMQAEVLSQVNGSSGVTQKAVSEFDFLEARRPGDTSDKFVAPGANAYDLPRRWASC